MAEEISRIKEYFYTHYLYNNRRKSVNASETADSSNFAYKANPANGNGSFTEALLRAEGVNNKSLAAIFKEASARYNVPEDLLVALGYEESRFKSDAVSSAGAVGIMQLMPATAKYLGVSNPYDAEQNIMGGAKYLGQMLEKYNRNVDLALAAYGAGSGAVDRAGGIPDNMKAYIAKVHEFMEQGVKAPDTKPGNSAFNYNSRDKAAAELYSQEDFSARQEQLSKLIDNETRLAMMRMQMNLINNINAGNGSIF